MHELTNAEIAARLRRAAELLALQGANPFRVNAYRRAANTVEGLPRPVHALLAEGGRGALTGLRGVGEGIAAAIEQLLRTGRARPSATHSLTPWTLATSIAR